MNRREFISGAAAAAGLAGCCTAQCDKAAGGATAAAKPKGRFLFGVCQGRTDLYPMLKDAGFDFVEMPVANAFAPTKDEEWWKAQREKILKFPLPLRSCNGFLPGTFKITGKDADWAPILDYADIVCRRADEVGLKTVVFGSSGARNVPAAFLYGGKREWPEGFGIEEGRDQFAGFCKELTRRIAGRKVQVVIEPLCPNESNIINYVWQGMHIVNDVKSYNLQQLADFYHMLRGWESPHSIIEAGEHLKHCHVADFKRLFPGSDAARADELLPYFRALKEIGYTGGVSCECGWGEGGINRERAELAIRTLKRLEATC